MVRFNSCIEYSDTRSILECNEKGKSYRIENISRKKITKVKVDGCVGTEIVGKRCDYLFFVCEENDKQVIFIELKGGGLRDALKQIITTIEYLNDEFRGYQKKARIVGKGDVPGFENIVEYKKLFKLVNGDLKRRTNKFYSENI